MSCFTEQLYVMIVRLAQMRLEKTLVISRGSAVICRAPAGRHTLCRRSFTLRLAQPSRGPSEDRETLRR